MHLNTREEMRAYWLNQMKDGRTRFVLQVGILRAGVLCIAVFSIPSILGGRLTISSIVVNSLLIIVIGGTVCGFLAWYFIRRRYGLSF